MLSWYSDDLAAEADDTLDETDPLRSIVITPMSPASAARFWYGDQLSTTVSTATITTQTDITMVTAALKSIHNDQMVCSPAGPAFHSCCIVISDDEMMDTKDWNTTARDVLSAKSEYAELVRPSTRMSSIMTSNR